MQKYGLKFKRYDDMYYISEFGDVYSKFSDKLLKHSISKDGHHRVDIHGKHKFVHKLVYETWIGPIKKNEQINHYDDNKDHNHYSNLYAGNQKENVADQVRNGKRIGHIISVTIYDSDYDEFITFPSVKHFLKYSGHKCSSGSIEKVRKKEWFKERYAVISKERVETIESYNSLKKKYKKMLKSLNIRHLLD